MSKDVVIELVSESESELAAADLAPGEAVLTYVDATTRRSPAQNATFTGRPSISTNSSGSSEGLTQRSYPAHPYVVRSRSLHSVPNRWTGWAAVWKASCAPTLLRRALSLDPPTDLGDWCRFSLIPIFGVWA